MKTKTLTLAMLATIIGIGSAFASFLAPVPVHLRAIMTPGGPTECIPCGVSCDDSGSNVCLVIVPLRSGSTAIAKSTGPVFTYKPGCAIVLFDNQSVERVCTFTGNSRPIAIL